MNTCVEAPTLMTYLELGAAVEVVVYSLHLCRGKRFGDTVPSSKIERILGIESHQCAKSSFVNGPSS